MKFNGLLKTTVLMKMTPHAVKEDKGALPCLVY